MNSVRIRRDALPDHPWIFRKRLGRIDPGTRNGDPVRILTSEGKPAGVGLFHGKSQIAIRVLSRDADETIDGAFLESRIEAAIRLRRDVLHLDHRTDAWRVVNSEGDGLSGLIVDRYGPLLSVQIKCLALFRFASDIAEILHKHFPDSRIVYRRDPVAEKIEGFRVPHHGDETQAEITSDGIRMGIDVAAGHKTGAFLDQRDNRLLAASVAMGRRVLDLFTYEGAFALACAKAGAAVVRGADLDEKAIVRAEHNAALNDLSVEFRHADAFDLLRRPIDADFLLLDPPKWIHSRDTERAGRKRYLDINALGIAALPKGGLLMTSSCSGRLPLADFLGILRGAAARAGRDLRILAVRGAAPDHPLAANFPEGQYLKAVLAGVA